MTTTKKDVSLYPRMTRKPPFSVEAPGSQPVDGESVPFRNVVAKDKLLSSVNDEITTVFENLKWSAKKYGNKKAIGSRRVVDTHVENKKVKKLVDGVEQEVDKKWTYFELSGYTFLSFVEFEKLVLQLGAGLRKLGHEKDSKIHLFSATR